MKPYSDGRYVTFLRAHTVVHPATVLESELMTTGEKFHIADIPESRTEYTNGEEVLFGSVKAARAFCKAINGKEGGICRHGRGLPERVAPK